MAVNPVTAVTAVSNQRGQLRSPVSPVDGSAGMARVNPSSMAQLPLELAAARERGAMKAAGFRAAIDRGAAVVNEL
jgi:hypothetical protein